jgi:PhzF family phenazine biosynthesis protein
MKLNLYQIDAFANEIFQGNPAAVCPLDKWLPDKILQSIAEENNLSETAYYVPTETGFHIRWFTPKVEIDLCGHATLATAYVIFNLLGYTKDIIKFDSRSGELIVSQNNEWLTMDFPSQPAHSCELKEELIVGLGKQPLEVLSSEDYLVVFKTEEDIISLKPNFEVLSQLEWRGVIVTAPGYDFDFVSRFFAPKFGINEDPVTGSAHCALTPYWAGKLNKTKLTAKQLSKRTGELVCELNSDRVLISGKAVKYMEGTIF